jgi:hypothetical protein
VCAECGLTIVKEENGSHNCYSALAGYLQSLLNSKDYVIQVFKDEIAKKNMLI